MGWFRRSDPETRASNGGGDFFNAVVAQLEAQASTRAADAGATAAVEAAAGALSRAFADAERRRPTDRVQRGGHTGVSRADRPRPDPGRCFAASHRHHLVAGCGCGRSRSGTGTRAAHRIRTPGQCGSPSTGPADPSLICTALRLHGRVADMGRVHHHPVGRPRSGIVGTADRQADAAETERSIG